jgi:tetratricopeptide (TPR) repeat protein
MMIVKSNSKRLIKILTASFVGVGMILFAVTPRDHPINQSPAQNTSTAPSLPSLVKLPTAKLDQTDIALLNLLCAQQLSGAADINISNQLATLDQWAKRVKNETERHLYRFRANPTEYYSSEAYFRMLMMAVVFYEDLNIRYNPERISNPQNINPNDRFFADSRDIFIHGLIGDRHMGTCSSMPVLYAAVGRRLGYPLKLVTTKARYYDEHFKQWPFPVSEEEIHTEGYLKSLTAAEELAVFLSLRANCLKEAGQIQDAADCYAHAARLAPPLALLRTLASRRITISPSSPATPIRPSRRANRNSKLRV